jgi:hypothetical protein
MSDPRAKLRSVFERFDLDPRAGPDAITEHLRELAERTDDTALRREIREAWEALTTHPLGRLEAALDSHPETRAPLGAPPRPKREAVDEGPLDLRDLVPRPRVSDAIAPALPDERAILGPPPAVSDARGHAAKRPLRRRDP